MKKLLSLFAASIAISASAASPLIDGLQSQNPFVNPGTFNKKIIKKTSPATRADETPQIFGYCGDGYAPLGGIYGYLLEQAIEITPEMAQNWAGTQVTKVYVYFGQTVSSSNVLLYITEDLYQEPAVLQEVVMEVQNGWNEIELEIPYNVNGNSFFVGYQFYAQSASDFPLVYDGLASNRPESSWVGVGDSSGIEYDNFNEMYGSSCIRIELEGNIKPEIGVLTDGVLYASYLVAKNNPIELTFPIINMGSEPIVGVNMNCVVNGKPLTNPEVQITSPFTNSFTELPFGTLGLVEIQGISSEESGQIPITVNITGIKGKNGNVLPYEETMECEVSVIDKLYSKNIVVEEFTGTWCSWCPRGLVGMEYMEEKYGDNGFIGIAVHGTTSSGTDPMSVTSYAPLYSGISSWPGATMDREVLFDPSAETLEYYYELLQGATVGAVTNLKTTYSESTKQIEAVADVEFALDYVNAPYRLAFVITENNYGPYFQMNAYSGGSVQMGGWEEKGRSVSTMFNLVARDITTVGGIENSLPSNIVSGQSYKYSIDLSTENCRNINECYVTAMIIDTQSGVIVNALRTKVGSEAGVEGIEAELPSVYKVYNPQGVKVLETKDQSDLHSLPKGIYIINGKKVLL